MNGEPVTDSERMQIKLLHGQGMSATAIGKRIGRPVKTVTRIAADYGMFFDRQNTQAATAAAAADMKARRARIAQRLLNEAEEALDDLHRVYNAFAFAGKDGEFAQHLVMPVPQDKANLSRAASILLDQHRKLADFDSDTGADQARSMLAGLSEALGVAARAMESTDGSEPGG